MTHTTDQESPASAKRSTVPGWVLPGAISVVVLALVVIALSRGNAEFDATTPEGAVQTYLLAINEKRWEDAFSVLDPETFGDCDPTDLAEWVPSDPMTATLQRTTTGPTRTIVEVNLRFGGSGMLGGGWGYTEQFVLIERNGNWYLTDNPWPGLRWTCGEPD